MQCFESQHDPPWEKKQTLWMVVKSGDVDPESIGGRNTKQEDIGWVMITIILLYYHCIFKFCILCFIVYI